MMTLSRIRAIGTVSVIVLGVSMCSLRDANIRKEGAAQVVQSVAKQTEKTSAKANKARAAARSADDPVRLLMESGACRDCN